MIPSLQLTLRFMQYFALSGQNHCKCCAEPVWYGSWPFQVMPFALLIAMFSLLEDVKQKYINPPPTKRVILAFHIFIQTQKPEASPKSWGSIFC